MEERINNIKTNNKMQSYSQQQQQQQQPKQTKKRTKQKHVHLAFIRIRVLRADAAIGYNVFESFLHPAAGTPVPTWYNENRPTM